MLEIACLNIRIEDVIIVPQMRKPFDVLAEGFLANKSRGERTPIIVDRKANEPRPTNGRPKVLLLRHGAGIISQTNINNPFLASVAKWDDLVIRLLQAVCLSSNPTEQPVEKRGLAPSRIDIPRQLCLTRGACPTFSTACYATQEYRTGKKAGSRVNVLFTYMIRWQGITCQIEVKLMRADVPHVFPWLHFH